MLVKSLVLAGHVMLWPQRMNFYQVLEINVSSVDWCYVSEYKKAKQDIKKCAADTVRLQKKVKKGNE